MNIGFFSDTYLPQRNGVAVALSLYRQVMENLGHRVYIFVPKFESSYKRQERGVFECPSFAYSMDKGQRFAIPIAPMLSTIRSLNLDIIHVHSPFTMSFFAKAVSKSLKIPAICTHHTLFEYYLHYVPTLIRPSVEQTRKLMTYWTYLFEKVIAPTEKIYELLEEWGVPKEKLSTIPTGIDTGSFKNFAGWELKKELKIPDDEKVLLFVGRIAKEKNIDFLLRTFRKMLTKRKDINFVLVGEGDEKENLENLSHELGISDKVFFTGGKDRAYVIDAYNAADIFWFASFSETQGLVILESMTAGTPVVALGKMGVYDLLKNEASGGIMLSELNETDFASAVFHLIDDPEDYKRRSGMGLKFVEDNFSLEHSVEEMLRLYEVSIEEHKNNIKNVKPRKKKTTLF
ncbi:MAG TPA: glycosyltransferase [Thermotogota bacterium]|nr:glycosyltransferase [Thermotogota bacterium]HPJ88090.1 glycosyltransferase [Thermotogota bacterium]HPR96050.1 glycosyltransferase [Thermotogota bacterium]